MPDPLPTPPDPEPGAFPDYLPVSLVAEMVYCPRNVWYQYVEGHAVRTAPMVQGQHEEAQRTARETVWRPQGRHLRGVSLSSEALRLIAVVDAVAETKGEEGTHWRPIQYKTGTLPPDEPPGLRFPEFDTRPEWVQLCAEAMLLEEHLGQPIPEGDVQYTASKARRTVPFTDELRAKVYQAAEQLWQMLDAGRIPPPVADDRCPGCSFFTVCQPFEVRYLQAPDAPPPPARVIPRDVLGRTLYVDTQGVMVRLQGERLLVEARNEAHEKQTLAAVPIVQVEQVILVGAVQISTQALQTVLAMGVEVLFLTVFGRVKGRLTPAWHPNAHLRLRQYATHTETVRSLALARAFVAGKLENYRVMLMRSGRRGRSHEIDPTPALHEAAQALRPLLRQVPQTPDVPTLMGLEGQGSRLWFQHFGQMIRRTEPAFDFTRRSRRPPQDPVNALLGFAYALLLGDVLTACHAAGLDPYIGFLHRPRYGRPGLALDLMEEFRPLLADSVVLTLLNTGMTHPHHFEEKMGGVYLNEEGRKVFYRAWNERRQEEVVHPLFGYRLPYHRLLEAQARLLAKVIAGELDAYIPFTSR
jgi:CRISPR-associated protein Cas1